MILQMKDGRSFWNVLPISLRIDMASVIQDITMDLMHHSSLATKLGEK